MKGKWIKLTLKAIIIWTKALKIWEKENIYNCKVKEQQHTIHIQMILLQAPLEKKHFITMDKQNTLMWTCMKWIIVLLKWIKQIKLKNKIANWQNNKWWTR